MGWGVYAGTTKKRTPELIEKIEYQKGSHGHVYNKIVDPVECHDLGTHLKNASL